MINKMNKIISIVLPVFNEEAILKELHQKLSEVISRRSERFEIIFVNDGSVDKSLAVLLDIRKQDNRVCIIDFARNFGHQNSLNAGLRETKGDAVILMDADLEDSPKDILKFLEKWDIGYEVVYAIRKKRNVPWLKSLLFKPSKLIPLGSAGCPITMTYGGRSLAIPEYMPKKLCAPILQN